MGPWVRAARGQQVLETQQRPFGYRGRPPTTQKPFCGSDTQAPPRNRDYSSQAAPSQLLCTALGLPLLGPRGPLQGAGGSGAENAQQVKAAATVCAVTRCLPPAVKPPLVPNGAARKILARLSDGKRTHPSAGPVSGGYKSTQKTALLFRGEVNFPLNALS